MKKNLLKLANFVKLLKENKIHNFNIESFESRLRLQKYVYIAKELFGMKFDYSFDLYLRGPYSSSLADDYYRLDFKGDLNKAEYENFERFKEFVKDKKARELEIIATTHFILKGNEHLINYGIISKEELEEFVVKKVCSLKRVNKDIVKKALQELGEVQTQNFS